MSGKVTTVHYDGQVFRPEEALGLEPNRRYQITILSEVPSRPETAWDVLDRYAGSVEGPGDMSAEVDHYLYGLPKRGDEAS